MTGKKKDTTPNPGEPDADAPMTDAEFARAMSARQARKARKASGLTQDAFAARYGIPVATVRDWEQGRRAPDAAAASYLKVIAHNPEMIAKTLQAENG